ncbi:MAG: tRNA (adenosine(37)-N6)-threonylcarbamoyltransferase complex dimerization subunit type 1 TsaB [Wolbachia endosymbiont of Menacanthus eurysternus]|nr:MAG: tRNA (adenosine(37)-N6)-threonylcarbamoyltransferase complex dimerization subunit type 1 TsaB [Wolbachia endosymbiont of Menacanthus eurysternus]
MSILAIDTVSTNGSVAIVDNNKNYFVEQNPINGNNMETFFLILNTLFNKYNYNYNKIDYLVVITGPGSFTGIRIGISAAKGISLATNKPLFGVSTLEVQAYMLSLLHKDNTKNIKAIIKNTQGFYTQLFDFNLLPLSDPILVSKSQYTIDNKTITDNNYTTHINYNNLPKLNAGHAGLLFLHKMENKQKLNAANALYLNNPQYTRLS